MSNLFDRATIWLAAKTQSAAGRSVVYARPGVRLSINSTRMSEDEQAIDATGAMVIVRQHSFVIIAADLAGLEPRSGDRITETVAGAVMTWEVMPHAGSPCWKWEDDGGLMLRVFVKEVAG